MPILITVKDPDLYEDPEFPHDNTSIGSKLDRTLRWIPARRLNPSALAPDWYIFDGIEPADLLQGSVGDCWLIASMAVLSEFPQAVRSLFARNGHREKGGIPRNGMYVVRLFDHKQGAFRDITLDEYIPYQPLTGLPEFAKPHGNELWALMIEKAMAKLFGTYSHLDGLNPAVAFRAFTGESDNSLWEREDPSKAAMRTAIAAEAIWQESKLKAGDTSFVRACGEATRRGDTMFEMLHDFSERNYLMCASMSKGSQPPELGQRNGLVEDHTYSIMRVDEVEGHKLIKMRNPWGNDKEWRGAWSDKDSNWVLYPKVRERLRPSFGPDGIFWMSWSDFSQNFSNIYVCHRAMQGRAGEQSPEGTGSKRLSMEQKLEFAKTEVQRLFKLRDKNSDQFLDEQEMGELMRDLGMEVAHASRLMAAADKNKDGKIDVQEFLDWVLSNRTQNQKRAMNMAIERGVRRSALEKPAEEDKSAEASPETGEAVVEETKADNAVTSPEEAKDSEE